MTREITMMTKNRYYGLAKYNTVQSLLYTVIYELMIQSNQDEAH